MRWILVISFLLSLLACASSPKIQRYTLHTAPASVSTTPYLLKGGLGVGPIELPESWRRGEVVVWGAGNKIIADDRHLWAGDPKLALSRVLAGNLSQQLQLDDVWAYPWDARAKPKSQVLLVVESFGGPLGGVVELKVKWRLLADGGSRVLVDERRSFSAVAPDKSYEAYVSSLNQLVNELSSAVEQSIRINLKSD